MTFEDIEKASRLEEMGDYLCPPFQVREPAENAAGSVNDVELAFQVIRPSSLPRERANSIALSEKSTPVTFAPSLAQESVSMPK